MKNVPAGQLSGVPFVTVTCRWTSALWTTAHPQASGQVCSWKRGSDTTEAQHRGLSLPPGLAPWAQMKACGQEAVEEWIKAAAAVATLDRVGGILAHPAMFRITKVPGDKQTTALPAFQTDPYVPTLLLPSGCWHPRVLASTAPCGLPAPSQALLFPRGCPKKQPAEPIQTMLSAPIWCLLWKRILTSSEDQTNILGSSCKLDKLSVLLSLPPPHPSLWCWNEGRDMLREAVQRSVCRIICRPHVCIKGCMEL